jgi:hypothetical protein
MAEPAAWRIDLEGKHGARLSVGVLADESEVVIVATLPNSSSYGRLSLPVALNRHSNWALTG